MHDIYVHFHHIGIFIRVFLHLYASCCKHASFRRHRRLRRCRRHCRCRCRRRQRRQRCVYIFFLHRSCVQGESVVNDFDALQPYVEINIM